MELSVEFKNLLREENLIKCLIWVKEKLEKGDTNIVNLYTKILTPALIELVSEYWLDCERKFCSDVEKDKENIFNNQNDEKIEGSSILHEHIKTSIIRTLVENCFPYVIKEIENNNTKKHNKKVIVTCPYDEFHELGARMASDFFLLAGYSVIYLGSNTPEKSFIAAIKEYSPDYIALSIHNPYHIVTAKKTLARIKELNKDFKIIVGGNAFRVDKSGFKNIGADYIADSFEAIMNIREDITEVVK